LIQEKAHITKLVLALLNFEDYWADLQGKEGKTFMFK